MEAIVVNVIERTDGVYLFESWGDAEAFAQATGTDCHVEQQTVADVELAATLIAAEEDDAEEDE